MPARSSAADRIGHLLLALLLVATAGCAAPSTPSQAPAERPTIVTLAPSLTEMVYAIGAGEQLLGRTSACDYPSEALSAPVAGAFGRPSLEMLASLHPDLVLSVDLADATMPGKIEELGMRHETIACSTPNEVPGALRRLGELTGHAKQADSLATVIEKGLAAFGKQAEASGHKPTIYLELWDDPFWTGGRGSYTSALIGYAGGSNIGDVVDKEYFEISEEWVIQRNPEVIACMYMSKKASAAGKLAQRAGWQGIEAISNNRVHDGFDNSLFLRPGPRLLEGIGQLRRVLHPDEAH